MDIKRISMIFLVACLIIITVGCTKAASTAPKATATNAAGGFPLPGTPAEDVMSQLQTYATQTAMVMQGNTSGTSTPAPQNPQTPVATKPAATPTVAQQVASQPTPKIHIPEATPGVPRTYSLHAGEFPFCIARRFDVNVSELLNINGLGTNSQVHSGEVLKIPQNGHGFAGQRSLKHHPTTYVVKSGDTIYTIACLFGDVSPDQILAANGLASPNKISPGDRIEIP